MESFPSWATSLGGEALELGRTCGLVADWWQAYVVERMLGLDAAGKFVAREVAINVARQNGKGVILELRELAGVFLLDEKLIVHSAHQQDTSLEHMRRLLEALEEGSLDAKVKRVRTTNGQEMIEFKTGQRIRFRTRSKGAGRGFTGDATVFDEAMFLAEYAHGAMMPALSARPNPQVIYAGSAADQEIHENAIVWSRLRERGHAGDKSLAYFEWSIDLDNPNDLTDEIASDPVRLKHANPALGTRISEDWVDQERRSMSRREFAVERGGVGDWPRTDGVTQSLLGLEAWRELVDVDSVVLDPVCLAFDVGHDRTAAIAAAGMRADGLWHVEVIENRTGTSWLPKRLAEYVNRHRPAVVICDAYGPVASILSAVEQAGVPVSTVTAGQHGWACGRLVDAVTEKRLRHLGSDELTAAIRGAKPRPLGDAWAWSRKHSSVDISPLVAVTLALSAAMDQPASGDIQIW